MKDVILWGAMGLWVGMALQVSGFSGAAQLSGEWAGRRSAAQRALLYTLGLGMMLSALLCWLAVIDVDWIEVAPLHAGTILGGIMFGMAAGLTEMTPATALTGLGGGRFWESLCGVLGCAAGAALGSRLPLEGVQALAPRAEGTLFHLTLRDGFALPGGFSTLACLGLLVCTVALMIPMVRGQDAPPEEELPDGVSPDGVSSDGVSPDGGSSDGVSPDGAARPDMEEPTAEAPLPEDEILPEDRMIPGEETASDETFVALLPEEEPMIIDTAEPDEEEETHHDEQET